MASGLMEMLLLPPPAKISEMVTGALKYLRSFSSLNPWRKAPSLTKQLWHGCLTPRGMSPPCMGCSAGCMEHLSPHLLSNPCHGFFPLEPDLDLKAEPPPAVAPHNGHLATKI